MYKPTELQKKLWTTLIFLAKFIAFAIPLHLVLWLNIDTNPLQEMTAHNTYSILKLFGQDVDINGVYLFTKTFAFQFVRDCTAWKSILAFAALVVATPFVRNKSKGIALLWGVPAIYIINLIRTSSTIYIGIVSPNFIEVVHTFLWREGLIAVIFLMWLVWFKFARDDSLKNYDNLQWFTEKINKILN